jgi:superoxide dismutase, Fe-Mn family
MFNKKNIIFLLFIVVLAFLAMFYFRTKTAGGDDSEQSVDLINQKEVNMKNFIYLVQEQLKPSGLRGISDEQIEDHWKLYKGYVAQVNNLREELVQLRIEGKIESLAYADRRRRFGFEYNGMVLHEFYFGNLSSKKTKLESKELQQILEDTWGSYDLWVSDFASAGKTRGIGWAILCLDPTTNQFVNIFVAEHQDGNIAGFMPILVMDVWEHAYMVDHEAGGRGDYIKAFMQNINWEVVEKRFADAMTGKVTKRF